MVSTTLVVDLAIYSWGFTIHIKVNSINHELTIRIDEIWNLEFKNKRKFHKINLQESIVESVCKIIFKAKTKYH